MPSHLFHPAHAHITFLSITFAIATHTSNLGAIVPSHSVQAPTPTLDSYSSCLNETPIARVSSIARVLQLLETDTIDRLRGFPTRGTTVTDSFPPEETLRFKTSPIPAVLPGKARTAGFTVAQSTTALHHLAIPSAHQEYATSTSPTSSTFANAASSSIGRTKARTQRLT